MELTQTCVVNFKTENCNNFAAKVGDNATLSVEANEPVIYHQLEINFSIFPIISHWLMAITLYPDNQSTQGDLNSYDKFYTKECLSRQTIKVIL